MSSLLRLSLSRALAQQAIRRSCLGKSTIAATGPGLLSQHSLLSCAPMVLAKRDMGTGNFTPLWTLERAVSAGLLGIVPAALIMPNPVTEFLFALSVTAHIHWGMEAIAVDYVRPRILGELLPKIAIGSVYALSFITLGGLMYFNFTDVGLAHAIRMLWKL